VFFLSLTYFQGSFITLFKPQKNTKHRFKVQTLNTSPSLNEHAIGSDCSCIKSDCGVVLLACVGFYIFLTIDASVAGRQSISRIWHMLFAHPFAFFSYS
jgi:hypothetical protein